MCKISEALINSISFLPEEQRLTVLENFRQQVADYQGEKITGYIPRDCAPRNKRIRELFYQGNSIKSIAKTMNVCRKTVRKVIKGGAFSGV